MNFSFDLVKGAADAPKVLSAGIHNCTFKGLSGNTIKGKDGREFEVMSLNLDIEGYGEFTHNFFAPTSNERSESMYGPNPSSLENFLIATRIVLEALDPSYGEKIDSGELSFSAPTFAKMVAALKKVTDQFIGKETKIKLVPQNNGYAAIPGFPARITKAGTLGIANRFMGDTITLSDKEVRAIEAAKNAKPTNMAKKETNDLLDGMKADIEDDVDDLPF